MMQNPTLLATIIVSTVSLLAPAQAIAQAIPVSVDWNQVTGNATGLHYGLNVYQGFDPNIAQNASYQAGIRSMQPGILRYHRADMLADSSTTTSGWVKNPSSAPTWDQAKIHRAMMGSYPGVPTPRMMNIVGFPAAMKDASGRLKPEFYAAYADFCADLVRIINRDYGLAVRYWEVTNELDVSSYSQDMAELGRIYRQVAAAMRSVDPSIQIGGPAMANPYGQAQLQAFMREAYSQLDFVSVHSYSTSMPYATDAQAWQSAENRADAVRPARSAVAQAKKQFGDRPIAIFLTEFNISSNYRTADSRMQNEKGMIYDALALAAIANTGITGNMAWNEADGIYGKLGPRNGNWVARPATHVFNLYNQYFQGQIVKTSSPPRTLDINSTTANRVTTYAVKNGTSKALAVINRSGQPVQISLNWGSAAKVTAFTAAASGVTQQQIQLAIGGSSQTLAKDTIVFFVQP
jgi:Glycosyl hydrolases family 39